MDNPRTTPGALGATGELTTFYANEGGAARSGVLANMAWLLAGRHGSVPVLMIDWDLASPGLDGMFGATAGRPGLLELFEACRAQLDRIGNDGTPPDALARRVLAAVDWQRYVEPVDSDRPLYLLRAGRFDAHYGERAAGLDWDGLFHACPALFREFRILLAQAYRHVFIAAPGGRSAAVSVCTSLLPDKIVGLFTQGAGSLDGLCGVLQRAIDYRCSHEEEQRPLLLYPLPCAPASVDAERLLAWRHGVGQPGYQATLETLMQASYGRPDVSLESYFDHLQVQHTEGRSDPQALLSLLDWFDESYFPWQPRSELALLRAIGAALASFQGVSDLPDPATRPARARPAQPSALAGQVQFPALRPLVYRRDNDDAPTQTERRQAYAADMLNYR
jgi:hypothetical protein